MKPKGKNQLQSLVKQAIPDVVIEVGIFEGKNDIPDMNKIVSSSAGRVNAKKGVSNTSLPALGADLDKRHGWLTSKKITGKEAKKLGDLLMWNSKNGKITNPKAILTFVRDVFRSPILKGELGNNTKATAINKGFNRLMIGTGKFVNSIKAKIT